MSNKSNKNGKNSRSKGRKQLHGSSRQGKNKDIRRKEYVEYTGKVQMTREGYAFVSVEGEEEDIFVKAGKTRGALNGDTVVVAASDVFRGKDRRREGEVVEIVERSRKPFVGILHTVGQQAWVLMQSKVMPYDISIDVLGPDGKPFSRRKVSPEETFDGALVRLEDGSYEVKGVYETVDGESKPLAARRGVKVAAIVDGWDRGEPTPRGHLVDVLGEPGENDTEMHAILAEFGLPYRFEPEVEKAADKISDTITDKDRSGRRDFRDTLTFTIDPTDAKDFDDALSYKALPNGNVEVGVHIADVSYYVRPGTAVDKEARERGTSVYLVDRTVPMLPEKLSNKLCSLRPGEEKLTFSAVFEITRHGTVETRWFGRTEIISDYRFDYDGAQAVIEDPEGSRIEGCTPELEASLKEALLELNKLATIFRKKRFASGAISFERPEMKVETDEKGKPVKVYEKVTKEANWLIEEFMLLANRSVAELIATGGKFNGEQAKDARTFVYRIHDEPNPVKIEGLKSFVSNFGYKMDTSGGSRSIAKSLNSLLGSADGKPEKDAFEMMALRSMAKASYSTDNIGHYGLAFPFYTHFTSPIRRYPDTMVHRLLSLYLDGGKSQDKNFYEEECRHASEREVIAAEAERASIKYKLVEYMEDKVGQEFDGKVSGLTEWGMYVEIEPTKIEGMIPLREIRSDYYEFDADNYRTVGRRSKKVFYLGTPVRIRVKSTNLEQKLLDYELVEPNVEDPDTEGPSYGGPQAPKTRVRSAIKASRKGSKSKKSKK